MSKFRRWELTNTIEKKGVINMNEDSLKHGAFGWHELMTTDVEAAKAFYSKLFGWEMVEYPMDVGTYWGLKVNGDEVGGMMNMTPEMSGMPPVWGIYITVDDVDQTARQVESLGGKIMRPPSDIPDVGRFCVFADPQGAVIQAITYVQK